MIEKDVQEIRAKHIRRQGFNPISKYLGFLTQRSYLGPLEEKAQKANVHFVIVALTDVQRALLQCLFMAKLSANIKVYNE